MALNSLWKLDQYMRACTCMHMYMCACTVYWRTQAREKRKYIMRFKIRNSNFKPPLYTSLPDRMVAHAL